MPILKLLEIMDWTSYDLKGGSSMDMTDKTITNCKELEFVIFCIEEVAASLGVNAELVYAALTEKSDILYGYIVPEYEVLHTQSRDYIVNEILDVMRERGVAV